MNSPLPFCNTSYFPNPQLESIIYSMALHKSQRKLLLKHSQNSWGSEFQNLGPAPENIFSTKQRTKYRWQKYMWNHSCHHWKLPSGIKIPRKTKVSFVISGNHKSTQTTWVMICCVIWKVKSKRGYLGTGWCQFMECLEPWDLGAQSPWIKNAITFWGYLYSGPNVELCQSCCWASPQPLRLLWTLWGPWYSHTGSWMSKAFQWGDLCEPELLWPCYLSWMFHSLSSRSLQISKCILTLWLARSFQVING